MTIPIIISVAGVVGAISMYIAGYFMAAGKYKSIIDELTDRFDLEIDSLRRDNLTVQQQMHQSLHRENETKRAYAAMKNDYMRFREFYNKGKDHNAKLSMNYAKLQQEYTRINFDRATLLKKMDVIKQITLPSSKEFEEVKQKLTTTQSELERKHHDNEALRNANETLTEAKKQLLQKLQKVYAAYKNMSTKATLLQKKAAKSDSINAEKDTISLRYTEAMEDLKKYTEQMEHLQNIENEKNDLTVKMEVLKAQVDDLELVRQENETLKEQIKELETLQHKVGALKAENSALRAKDIFIDEPRKPARIHIGNNSSKYLENVIGQLADIEGYRGAVLADNLGLAVAGSGEYKDALAEMAAVFSKIEHRIHSQFSFGSLQKLVISDDNELTLSAYPFPLEEDKLVLTMLSLGAGLGNQQVKDLMAQVDA